MELFAFNASLIHESSDICNKSYALLELWASQKLRKQAEKLLTYLQNRSAILYFISNKIICKINIAESTYSGFTIQSS